MTKMVFGNPASEEYKGRDRYHMKEAPRIGTTARALCGRTVRTVNIKVQFGLVTCPDCLKVARLESPEHKS